jgi:hypothetical protein
MRKQIDAWAALSRWLGWSALVVLTARGPRRWGWLRWRVLGRWADADRAMQPYLREP